MTGLINQGPDGRAPTNPATGKPTTTRTNKNAGTAGSQPKHITPTPAWWAQQLLARLGFPRTPQNMEAIEAWEAAEGGHWHNTAAYNPLNTTQPMPGSGTMNSVGVRVYTSWEQGLDATVETLRNGNYGQILAALKAGDDASAVTEAVTTSPWGTHSISLGAASSYANTSRPNDGQVPSSGPIPAAASGGPDTTTAGGGGGSAAPATTAQIDSYIEANYGYLAAFLKNPAVAPLLEYAAKKQLSADAIRGLLTDTGPHALFPQAVHWYETTSQTARQFESDGILDPATQRQQIAQQATAIAQQAKSLGVPISTATVNQMAVNSLKYGWSQQQIQLAIAADFHYQQGTNYGGTVGKSLMQLNQQATDYLVPVSQPTLGKWVQQIVAGTQNADDFTTFLQRQAENLYPTIASALKGGMTTKDYLDPYMQIAQSTLEREFTPQDFMNNPRYMKALNTTTPDGQRAPMSLADWTTYLRTLPEYQNTQQARQQAGDMAHTVLSTFGKVAT